MRNRILLTLASLALVAAACGQEAGPTGEGLLFRYAYQPGDELIYNTDLAMTMDMTTTGDLGIPGGFDVTMEMEIAADSRYEIEEGPDPETVRLITSTEIVDGRATMEMMGMTEEIPLHELSAEMDALDTEVIIDAQGNIVEMLIGGQAIPPGLLDSFGGAGGGSLLSSFGSGQLLGPELPEQPVSVGSAWTTELDETTFGIRVRSVSEHRVTAREVVAGRDTYRIETTTTTEAISFSFDDLLTGLAADPAMLELAGDPASQAELQAGMAMFEAMGIEMDYTMERSVSGTTTWFDVAAGVMVRMEMTMPQQVTISMKGIPDTGDIEMVMDTTTTTTMQLTG